MVASSICKQYGALSGLTRMRDQISQAHNWAITIKEHSRMAQVH